MFSIFWPIKFAGGFFKLALNLLVFLSCILTILAFMGGKGWEWSLTTHFRMQYLAVQLLALLLASLAYWFSKRDPENPRKGRMEQWCSILFLAFFAGLNLVQIAPYYLAPKPEIAPNASKLKLMHMNLFGFVNHRSDEVIKTIRTEKPDVLDLVEYTDNWQNYLEKSGVLKAYPYRIAGRAHIGLYSKRPLRNPRLTYAGIQKVANQANIIAQITVDRQPVTILVAHPASPIMPSHLQWLKESFNAWTAQRSSLGKNLLIVGDLNTTPWSKEFGTLIQNTGLRDSQLGYGIQPSWPMLLPFFGVRTEPNWLTQLLQIPIDHVLVSDRIQIVSRRTGPFVGSDHLPVIVEFAIGKGIETPTKRTI